MKVKYINAHFITRVCIVLVCVLVFAALAAVQQDYSSDLTGVTISSGDGAVYIKWNSPRLSICDSVIITISDKNSSETKTFSPKTDSYVFTEGKSGTLYDITVTAKFKNGTYGQPYEKQAFFISYDEVPELPVLIINTANGLEPSYEYVYGPENTWGISMVDNDYVSAELTVPDDNTKKFSYDVKIKVRGNSSSTMFDKKSYKIAFDKPVDLSGTGKAYREWVLLNSGTTLNNYVGTYISNLCGMQWQPDMTYVNVILNGDWKGCYTLTQNVNYELAGEYVSKNGYIFENDVYWWNADGIYFKTEAQDYAMGYTFRYPEINSVDDERLIRLQEYMQTYEYSVFDERDHYKNFIDEENFASWILARDILGQADGGGSNIYFYKYDFDVNNPTSTKLKMGPLWDFDTAFYISDDWSDSRLDLVSYFPQLFMRESFSGIYAAKWSSISENLAENVQETLMRLYDEEGEAIQKSWELDAERWGFDIAPLNEQISDINEWFINRISWIDNELGLK